MLLQSNDSEGLLVQGGTDAGDHPPITPVRGATEAEIGGGDSWRLYDYVARHFLGSISPDCVFRRMRASFACGTETFTASGTIAAKPGFTAIMPWRVGAVCLNLAKQHQPVLLVKIGIGFL